VRRNQLANLFDIGRSQRAASVTQHGLHAVNDSGTDLGTQAPQPCHTAGDISRLPQRTASTSDPSRPLAGRTQMNSPVSATPKPGELLPHHSRHICPVFACEAVVDCLLRTIKESVSLQVIRDHLITKIGLSVPDSLNVMY